jgi:long-chain fatty acid transport protein
MKKRYLIKQLLLLMSTAGAIGLTSQTIAAAFQLWEQDGATVGNYHAGRAAEAADASTAFYNPAGLVRIKNQQIVIGIVPIMTAFKFHGTVNTTTADATHTTHDVSTVVEGGTFNAVPNLNYAAPLSSWAVFGFSVVAPFGLNINYGYSTNMRYALTQASLRVIDVSPSIGIAVTNKFSIGAGIDLERARGEFDSVATIPNFGIPGSTDTQSINVGYSNGLGYHLGIMYQFTSSTRIGLSYQSKVNHHLRGNSRFTGQLANSTSGGTQSNNNLSTNIHLPPTTAISLFHIINPIWDVMGTVQYTQWNVISEVVLKNVSGATGAIPPVEDNTIVVIVPQHYHNTWNYSVGANYHVNDKWIVRGGIGYDETPSNDAYRNVILPDSSRIAIALGVHYQANESFGFDAGWTHLFAFQAKVNSPPDIVGPQTVLTNGTFNGNADVLGFQVKWDIA